MIFTYLNNLYSPFIIFSIAFSFSSKYQKKLLYRLFLASLNIYVSLGRGSKSSTIKWMLVLNNLEAIFLLIWRFISYCQEMHAFIRQRQTKGPSQLAFEMEKCMSRSENILIC